MKDLEGNCLSIYRKTMSRLQPEAQALMKIDGSCLNEDHGGSNTCVRYRASITRMIGFLSSYP